MADDNNTPELEGEQPQNSSDTVNGQPVTQTDGQAPNPNETVNGQPVTQTDGQSQNPSETVNGQPVTETDGQPLNTPGSENEDGKPPTEFESSVEKNNLGEQDENVGEDKNPNTEIQGEDKMRENEIKKKEMKSKRLFDSKGSLLENESFVKETIEEFKQKRATMAVLISNLQAKAKEYKEKENPTNDDTVNMRKYHAAFLEKLSEYEGMTRSLERIMGMEDVSTSQLDMSMSGPLNYKQISPAAEKSLQPSVLDSDLENRLPKLIVCGTDMGDSVPRLIVCEPLKKADLEPFHKTDGGAGGSGGGVADVMDKLNESFRTKQKLAAENTEMANMRLKLQQELLEKQDMLDCMKQKIIAMESDKYRIQSENEELQKQLFLCQKSIGPPMCKRELYLKFRGTSPDEGTTNRMGCTKNLEQELNKMCGDVKNIYSDLHCIQREKAALGYSTSSLNGVLNLESDGTRKCCVDMENTFPEGPCMTEALDFQCARSPGKPPVCKRMLPQKSTQTDGDKEKDIVFATDQNPKMNELKEQYQRLHNDFKYKVTEVASLRVDLERTRRELDATTIVHHELEAMYQKQLDENAALIADKNQMEELKDKTNDMEQQANIAKQMYMTSQEEIEEMRLFVEDQALKLDEYRNKYISTLQIAEELKKENNFKERECADQIALNTQKIKLEMQEQLEELSPIKDLLRITQQKLKETEQMHSIALETIANITKQLEDSNNEVEELKSKLESTKTDGDLNINLINSLENADKRLSAMESKNDHLQGTVNQLEALQVSQAQKLEKKTHELLQMTQKLETLREESARQVARLKERSEVVRTSLQAQIAEMEIEVAMCRATTSFANRERDEIRSKLQMEVCLLSENFQESQNRILQLQQHVNYLSASHLTLKTWSSEDPNCLV